MTTTFASDLYQFIKFAESEVGEACTLQLKSLLNQYHTIQRLGKNGELPAKPNPFDYVIHHESECYFKRLSNSLLENTGPELIAVFTQEQLLHYAEVTLKANDLDIIDLPQPPKAISYVFDDGSEILYCCYTPSSARSDGLMAIPLYDISLMDRFALACLQAHPGYAAKSTKADPSHPGVGKYCTVGPASEQQQTYLLKFEDNSRSDAVLYDESEARALFAAAESRGWNCHLFELVNR
jgi:hypothetical protein